MSLICIPFIPFNRQPPSETLTLLIVTPALLALTRLYGVCGGLLIFNKCDARDRLGGTASLFSAGFYFLHPVN